MKWVEKKRKKEGTQENTDQVDIWRNGGGGGIEGTLMELSGGYSS